MILEFLADTKKINFHTLAELHHTAIIHSSTTQTTTLFDFLFSSQDGVTPEMPSETEALLLLWILTYCCFILHHLIST